MWVFHPLRRVYRFFTVHPWLTPVGFTLSSLRAWISALLFRRFPRNLVVTRQPSGLKPASLLALGGTAEALPRQKLIKT